MTTVFFMKWFWAIALFINIVNFILMKVRTLKYVKEDENLRVGYNFLLKNYMIYFNIPWLIMGTGNLTKFTQSFLDYMNPRSMNIFVLLFHAYILSIIVLFLYWIYKKDGAEILSKYKGIFGGKRSLKSKAISPTFVKVYFTIAAMGGIGGLIAMWFMEMPDMSLIFNI